MIYALLYYTSFLLRRGICSILYNKTGLEMIARSDFGDLPVSLFRDPKLENDVWYETGQTIDLLSPIFGKEG